jgi:hypothetical protein
VNHGLAQVFVAGLPLRSLASIHDSSALQFFDSFFHLADFLSRFFGKSSKFWPRPIGRSTGLHLKAGIRNRFFLWSEVSTTDEMKDLQGLISPRTPELVS